MTTRLKRLRRRGLMALAALSAGGIMSIIYSTPTMAAAPDMRFDSLDSWLCLDVTNWGANGASVQQWGCSWGWAPQQWDVTNPQEYMNADGRRIIGFEIKTRTTSRCLDVSDNSTANGASVIVRDCNGRLSQHWQKIDSPRGYGTVSFRALHSDKCLEVYGFSKAYGGKVVQWDCWNGPNQVWYWRYNP